MEVVNNGCSIGCGAQLCFNDFEFKFPHILWEIIDVADTCIGKPGGGFCGGVGTLENGLEICDKVWEGSKGRGI